MIKGGLGKGLDALFPSQESKVNQNETSNSTKEVIKKDVEEVDIKKIVTNKDQPRKVFNEKAIEELSISIRKYGIIQPIVVIEKDGKYEIVAGERRYRAALKAELKKVPVIIKKYDEKTKGEVSLIENIQRENLNILEQAQALKDIMEKNNLSQEELSKRIGKSRSAISNTIRILKLSDKIKQYIWDGKLTEGHSKLLLSLDNEELQEKLADKIVEKDLSVRQVEDFIRSLNEPKSGTIKKKVKNDIWIQDIEERFKNFFQTKVHIKHGKDKGQIILEYYSNDELDRIIEIIDRG